MGNFVGLSNITTLKQKYFVFSLFLDLITSKLLEKYAKNNKKLNKKKSIGI